MILDDGLKIKNNHMICKIFGKNFIVNKFYNNKDQNNIKIGFYLIKFGMNLLIIILKVIGKKHFMDFK